MPDITLTPQILARAIYPLLWDENEGTAKAYARPTNLLIARDRALEHAEQILRNLSADHALRLLDVGSAIDSAIEAAALAVARLHEDGHCGETTAETIERQRRNATLTDAQSAIRALRLGASAIRPISEVADVGGIGITFEALHQANIDRQGAWCPEQKPDLSFRGNELAGEVGEACNVIKKLERERLGWAGSRDTLDHLAEELADVVICADLCAVTAGIDLGAAVVRKWDATSEKVGLPHRLRTASTKALPAASVPK